MVKEYHFSLSSGTLNSPELRAGNRESVVISMSEVGKADRKFKVQRKCKIPTLLKWLMKESKLGKEVDRV